MAKLIGIVAKNKNGVIGNGGALPWEKDSEDIEFFRGHTVGEIVVMGRKTWQSIGEKPLPNRVYNLVLSATLDIETTSTATFKTVQSVLNIARDAYQDVYVIGGAQIYQAFAPFIEQWLVTEINDISTGDIFFNESWLAGFTQVNQKIGYKGNKYITYEKSL
jgi:dihydrofolate reductase